MKLVFVFLLVVVYVWAQDHTATQRPAGSVTEGGFCSHQSDCGSDLCCATSGFGRRKRFLFGPGICRPYGQLNSTCMPFMSHDIFNHELYSNYCPCQAPLECRGETVNEGPGSIQHVNPKCQTKES